MTKVSPLAPKGGFPKLPLIQGVEFAAAAAGVKYQGRNDVMLAKISAGSSVAGVFTQSSTRSAPVLDCQAKLAAGVPTDKPIGLLVNSGNSNAFTGARGDGTVNAVCKAVAESLSTDTSAVFTASTGVIGEPLDSSKITSKIHDLTKGLDIGSAQSAAQAIMTTDTFAKGSGTTVDLDGGAISIAGFAKGSGMIAPDMATMLVYIFTDAKITSELLQSIVSDLNQTSFNSITVDSDTSTSDSLMVFATGQTSAEEVDSLTSDQGQAFRAALNKVMMDLAHQVVRDGEGASKFVEVRVTGATDTDDARRVALSIANSPLVKTAVAGEDPNWGRIVMAVGKSGAQADRDLLTIKFGDILVAENGWVAESYTEAEGSAYMKQQEIVVSADLGLGKGTSTVWTCDLTHNYISINADYRS